MKLEEEIKQKKFASEMEKASLNIIVTANWLTSQFHALLKPFGISQEQYNVLRILRGQHPNPCTLGTITERMVNKMSNATRLVDKLKKSDYVSREVCPTNRRKVDILITNKGLDLLAQLDPIMESKLVELKCLDDSALTMLNETLDSLRN